MRPPPTVTRLPSRSTDASTGRSVSKRFAMNDFSRCAQGLPNKRVVWFILPTGWTRRSLRQGIHSRPAFLSRTANTSAVHLLTHTS